jgi:hypothetical protein
MFYLYGTAISPGDARYLLTALGALGSPEAMDAAEMIAMGITSRRSTVPLSPAMQDAVCVALAGQPSDALVELRTRVRRKTCLSKSGRRGTSLRAG